MMLAIHNSSSGFHPRWVSYCKTNKIPFKRVNCHDNDLVEELKDCKALLWHHSQGNPNDILIAKQILFALEQTGFSVFPDFRTSWHFDDKLAQKYLLEAMDAPMVPSYAFYNKSKAIGWSKNTNYPKVFKLRRGAGSANVKLVKDQSAAIKLINRMFGKGISTYDASGNLKERWRKFTKGKGTFWSLLKGVLRFGIKPSYTKVFGREKGYVYFQDFIANNDFDIRIIVIGGKAFALKRFVRENDFRASGSGNFKYNKEEFDERCVAIAFEVTDKLGAQCVAYDFIFNQEGEPMIIEISYGFSPLGYDDCPGYWDKELNWYEENFNPQGWMIDMILLNN